MPNQPTKNPQAMWLPFFPWFWIWLLCIPFLFIFPWFFGGLAFPFETKEQ